MNLAINYENKFISFVCLSPFFLFICLMIPAINFFVWLVLILVSQAILLALYKYIVLYVFRDKKWQGYLVLLVLQVIVIALIYQY